MFPSKENIENADWCIIRLHIKETCAAPYKEEISLKLSCWQEGDRCCGSFSRWRHEQPVHVAPQRRHFSLHHQVGAGRSGSVRLASILKLSYHLNKWLWCFVFDCRDIAAAIDRKEKYHFDEMIYVVRILHPNSPRVPVSWVCWWWNRWCSIYLWKKWMCVCICSSTVWNNRFEGVCDVRTSIASLSVTLRLFYLFMFTLLSYTPTAFLLFHL